MLQVIRSKVIRCFIAVAGVVALFQTISILPEAEKSYVATTNSFLGFWCCILSVFVFHKICENIELKITGKTILAILYSGAFSFALVVGKQLDTMENLNVGDGKLWLTIIVLVLYFTPFVIYAWDGIENAWKALEKAREQQRTKGELEQINFPYQKSAKIKEFLHQWGIIFLCWLPVFFAFYPGAFVYDAMDEYMQVAAGEYTTHHPLLHVLFLGKTVMLGKELFDSYNTGIAIYTLIQMAILSGVFSYTISYVREKTKNHYVTWGAILFYGLFPVIPMYAVCSSKDGLFTAMFLLVIVKMLQFVEHTEEFLRKRGNVVVSIWAAVLMMLLRNNGMYAYIVWIPVMVLGCILCRKKKQQIVRIVMIMVASFLVFQGSTKLLTMATNADDSESQEIMTVPIQQLVRTYKYSPETYSEEEKQILYEILPEEDLHLYNARLSDLIKSKFNNTNFNQNKAKYLKLWAKVGFRKPMIYINAWLMTSYGYWYPDAVINVYGGNGVHTFTYQDSSYFGFETEPPGTRESKFSWLEEQYRKISLELYQQKVPGISMLFSPGCLFWVFMFAFTYFLQKGNWEKNIPLCGILLLWLTAVLGPTYLVRYVLILWFAMPVVIAETKE